MGNFVPEFIKLENGYNYPDGPRNRDEQKSYRDEMDKMYRRFIIGNDGIPAHRTDHLNYKIMGDTFEADTTALRGTDAGHLWQHLSPNGHSWHYRTPREVYGTFFNIAVNKLESKWCEFAENNSMNSAYKRWIKSADGGGVYLQWLIDNPRIAQIDAQTIRNWATTQNIQLHTGGGNAQGAHQQYFNDYS